MELYKEFASNKYDTRLVKIAEQIRNLSSIIEKIPVSFSGDYPPNVTRSSPNANETYPNFGRIDLDVFRNALDRQIGELNKNTERPAIPTFLLNSILNYDPEAMPGIFRYVQLDLNSNHKDHLIRTLFYLPFENLNWDEFNCVDAKHLPVFYTSKGMDKYLHGSFSFSISPFIKVLAILFASLVVTLVLGFAYTKLCGSNSKKSNANLLRNVRVK